MRRSKRRGSAIVVGGGIGGLATGLALCRIGWSVSVLEQAPTPSPADTALCLWPNAMRCLDRLGLARRVRALGAPSTAQGALRQVLRDALPYRCLRSGTTALSAVGSSDNVTLTYQTRSGLGREMVDVLVGADGSDSTVRQLCWPEVWPPLFDRRTVWGAVTAPGTVPIDPGLTLGPTQHLDLLPLTGGRFGWWLTARTELAGMPYPDELGEVRRRVAGWHDPINALLDATPPDRILHHDITMLDPLPCYVHRRVALLGDAAHPITPGLRQGACQALEDAVVLAASPLDDPWPPTALLHYDQQRRPRTQALARAALRHKKYTERYPTLAGLASRWSPAIRWRRRLEPWIDWTPPALHGWR